MAKFADYSEDTTPADGDLILTKDVSATATKKVTLLNLIKALVSFVSSFTAASTLDGTELVPISQGGNARKVTTQAIADLGGGGGTTLPVADTTAIVQGSSDATKQLRFEVDGFTAGTTRVVTFPDANITAARTDAAQTFVGTQTFSGVLRAPDGSAAAPSYSFTSQPGMGMSLTTSTILGFYIGGARVADFRPNASLFLPANDATVAFGGSADAGIQYAAAGVLKLTAGTGGAGRLQLEESADPSAPAANNAILYVRDNGSGKSQLVVRFPTGAVQVIATEP